MSDEGIAHPTVPYPLRAIVAGPSGSGKSTLVCSALRDQSHVFGFEHDEIRWCYKMLDPQVQALADELPTIQTVYGQPWDYIEELRNLSGDELRAKKKLVVIDDLMSEIGQKPELIIDLFTVGSHHLGLSCILLTQNFYFKNFRTPSLSANFLILMRMNRGLDQVNHIFGSTAEELEEKKLAKQAYKSALALTTYGHLCVDLDFSTDRRLKYFTGLLSTQARLYFLDDKDANRPILRN